MSKHCSIIFIAAVWFVALSVCVHAQEAQVDTNRFFHNTRPALLFGIQQMELTKYEGGIGCAFYGSDDLLWRISVDISLKQSNNESYTSTWSNWESNTHSTSFGLTASPMIVISRYDPGFVFVAPMLSGNYQSSNSTSSTIDSSVSMKRKSESDRWFAAAGIGLGVGIILTDRISLTGEYRIAMSYNKESSENTENGFIQNPALTISNNSEHNNFYQVSYVSFTFLYKL